jgi:excisionase family DNA binding protein
VLATEPVLITVEEAARYLRISRGKAYSMAAAGELPTVKLGRSVRVRRDLLERWLDERTAR